MDRRGVKSHADNGAAGVVGPPGASFAAPGGENRQPMGVWRQGGHGPVCYLNGRQLERPTKPGKQASPVVQRPAQNEVVAVRVVTPGARWDGDVLRPPQDAHCPGRADHESKAVTGRTAGSDVAATSIPKGRKPWDLAEGRPAASEFGAQAHEGLT